MTNKEIFIILYKYMKHVEGMEGTNFFPCIKNSESGVNFSQQEIDILTLIDTKSLDVAIQKILP